MTKKITPMTRLKGSFDKMIPVFKSLGIFMSEQAYHESRDEGVYSTKVKGVKSDLIRIFRVDDVNSFAFSYSYLEEDKTTISDNQGFEIIFKSGDVYTQSRFYTVEQAKVVHRNIVGLLETTPDLNKEKLLNLLKTMYELSSESIDEMEASFKEIWTQRYQPQIDALKSETQWLVTANDELSTANKALSNYYDELPETKEIAELEAQVTLLRSSRSRKYQSMKESLDIIGKENVVASINRTIPAMKNELKECFIELGLSLGIPKLKVKSAFHSAINAVTEGDESK